MSLKLATMAIVLFFVCELSFADRMYLKARIDAYSQNLVLDSRAVTSRLLCGILCEKNNSSCKAFALLKIGNGLVCTTLKDREVCPDGNQTEFPMEYYEVMEWKTKTKTLPAKGSGEIIDEKFGDCNNHDCYAFALIGIRDTSQPLLDDVDFVKCGNQASDFRFDLTINETVKISNSISTCGPNQVATAIIDTITYYFKQPDYYKCLGLLHYIVDSACIDLIATAQTSVLECPTLKNGSMHYVTGMWRVPKTNYGISGIRCCSVRRID